MRRRTDRCACCRRMRWFRRPALLRQKQMARTALPTLCRTGASPMKAPVQPLMQYCMHCPTQMHRGRLQRCHLCQVLRGCMQQPSSACTEAHVHHALDPGDTFHSVCRLLSTLTYSVPAIGHVRGRALDAVYRTVLQARSCTTARLHYVNACTCSSQGSALHRVGLVAREGGGGLARRRDEQ